MLWSFYENMISRFKSLCLLFLLLTTSLYSKEFKIKVLLQEFNSCSKSQFDISAEGELLIRGSQSPKLFCLKSPQIQIMAKNNSFFGRLNKKQFRKIKHEEIHIRSLSKFITINDIKYAGALSLIFKNNKVLLINTLNLEDYIYSVLLAESYPSWDRKMHEVQAIVSRTYAVKTATENKKKKLPYDIKNSTVHQRYAGSHDFYHLREAAENTKNLVLTHKNDVVLAMFDACCGGVTPALIRGLDFNKAPYLKRTTPCKYCRGYRLYSWKRVIPKKTFLRYLYEQPSTRKKLSKKKILTSIAINKRDKAGVVHSVTIMQGKKRVTLSGNSIWMSMCHIIKSQNFSLEQKGKNIIVKGRGYGHQTGLCQRGARELIRRKKSVEEVLAFYYPGTTIKELRAEEPYAFV